MVTNRDRKSFKSPRMNSKFCSDDWHPWSFWSAFRHFVTHFAESFRMSKYWWMTDPTRSLEIPSYSAIDLAQIRRSSKISSWICSITSGLVTVLGRPGQGVRHVKKSPHIYWTTRFWRRHIMVNIILMFLSEWREFPVMLCHEGKKLDASTRLHVSKIARIFWNLFSASVTRRDLQFGTWKDLSFQRYYRFRPTITGSISG